MRIPLSKSIGHPRRLKLVITSKFRNLHIVAPAAVRTTMFCNVRGNDRSGAPGESVIVSPVVRCDCQCCLGRSARLSFLPLFSYLFQCLESVLVHQTVTVRSDIENKIAVSLSHRDNVLIYKHIHILERSGRKSGFPEPVLLDRIA